MRHGDYLKKKAVQTGSHQIDKAYKEAWNSINKTIKRLKRNTLYEKLWGSS